MRVWRFLLVGLAFLPSEPAHAGWKSEGLEHASVTAFLVDPKEPTIVYAATEGSDLFKSTDGGASWAQIGDLSRWGVRWLQQDPAKKGTLYAGLEDQGGIRRSTDGGATWKPMRFPSSLPLDPGPLAFVPGAPGGIWFAGRNLHYKSADSGATWKEFRVANMDVKTFVFDPKNGKAVWAAGRDEGAGLVKSVDSGLTWKAPAAEGLPRERTIDQVIVDPNQPKGLYVRYGGYGGQVYWSDDDGAHFEELELRIKGALDGYEMVLDPTPGGALYYATGKGLLRSINHEPWRKLEAGLPEYYVKTIAVHPTEPDVVWAGPGGRGVYRSKDGGRSWKSSSAGLHGGWIKKIWADPVNAGTFLVDTSAGAQRKDAKGWHDMNEPSEIGGDEKLQSVVFDRKNPRSLCVGNGTRLFCSSDGGTSWSRPVKSMSSPSPSFEGFVQDLADPKTFYAGGWANEKPPDSILKSVDGGVKWKTSGKGLPKKEDVVLMRHESPKTLLALMKETGLYRSTDGALTWTKAGAGLPEKDIRELAVDPSNASNVYVATKQGVFRSSDGGASFSVSNQGMKDTDIESVAVAPTGGRAFAASSAGVFESKDAGATWVAFPLTGLATHDVRALAIGGGRLYIGTGGSGVFSTELP